MDQKEITFARNLVKGKIAETVFAQMLRSTGEFTVLDFGYEKIIPELVQQGDKRNDDMVETLRTAPDYAVINKRTKEVHLIEVKYRHSFTEKNVYDIAKRMSASWNPSYLLLASKDGFYYGEVGELVECEGEIKPLSHPQISQNTQDAFIKILNDFEL